VVVGVPDYVFGSAGIIKKMKTNGEWAYDEQMINILGLDIEPYITAYGKGGKAMTAAVVAHLQQNYPEKS
jgi:hypothetical protein